MREGYSGALIRKEEKTRYGELLKMANPMHGGDIYPFINFISKKLTRLRTNMSHIRR